MTEDRIDDARCRLLDLRRGPGAWGYRPRSTPAVEPSALAALALLAIDRDERGTSTRSAPRIAPEALAAARWLASIRRPDGSMGVTLDLAEPGWPTPLAMLAWAAVGGFVAERSAAMGWLLEMEGRTIPRTLGNPMGHDPSIVGWPWVADTHSWVEPTSMALLAIGREGRADHPRAIEGTRLLVNRAIPGGGWNLGNPIVFGTTLRPLPGPSGLALLALAMVADRVGEPSKVIAPAVSYLRKALAKTLAPISMGWGILGLRAWGAEPSESPGWIASAFDRASTREPGPAELAMLLLASAPRSLEILGLADRAEGARHD